MPVRLWTLEESDESLRARMQAPVDGALFDVEYNLATDFGDPASDDDTADSAPRHIAVWSDLII